MKARGHPADLIGIRIFHLVPLEHIPSRRSQYRCRCDCGNETIKQRQQLIAGTVKSCGCKTKEMQAAGQEKRRIDLHGRVFGRLTVLRFSHSVRSRVYWLCRCICGTEKPIWSSTLRSGEAVSCGCKKREWNKPDVPALARYALDRATGCWNWTGGKNQDGYGCFMVRVNGSKKPVLAHRHFYQHHSGPIPPGLFVCHSCDNPGCVNPGHLWIGTAKDNARDMVAKGRWAGKRALAQQGRTGGALK